MNEERAILLKDLLPARIDGLEGAIQDGLEERGNGRSAMAWRFIRSTAAGEVRKALDLDVVEVLAEAWAKARELREYRHKPPGEVHLLHLASHDLSTEVHPVLVVDLGTPPHPELRFALQVTARFEGAVLRIQDGTITGVETGHATATAQLKYRAVPLHRKEESPRLGLPGARTFRTPIRIV